MAQDERVAVVRRAPFSDNPRVGARGQRTQQRILDAALRAFGEQGYHGCSIERITSLARDLFDYRGTVVRQASAEPDYLVDNPTRRCPAIAKARTELGYDPSIELTEGLRRSLVWYSHNRAAVEA